MWAHVSYFKLTAKKPFKKGHPRREGSPCKGVFFHYLFLSGLYIDWSPKQGVRLLQRVSPTFCQKRVGLNLTKSHRSRKIVLKRVVFPSQMFTHVEPEKDSMSEKNISLFTGGHFSCLESITVRGPASK